jgi:TolB-like protein/Flp pilus assembly protein TadD
MISGRQPFTGDYEHAVIYSIIHTEPEPLSVIRDDVPQELERIISRCMARDPSDRYQVADDLISDLRGFQRNISSGEWPERVESAKRRSTESREFPGRMGKGLWLLLVCIPAIAFLIIRVIVPAYFSSEVGRGEDDRMMIAVLPFENLGPPAEEYFADGITEELIARLARVEDLGVIARTSIMRYKDSEMSIGDIGEELGVDYILDGSIRWQKISDGENRVRITPQLVRVSDETHLWAEVYQRDMTDIFLIQDEIAGRVVGSLGIALRGASEKGGRAPAPTDNTEAYHAYLEGRFWWNKRSQEGFDRAIELFEEAIRLDPGYALAYAGKAECYAMLAIHLARPGEYNEIARAAALEALDLDYTVPEAYNALGWVNFVYDRDFREAERLFLKAIELDPKYATAYNWYGVMLACVGRDDEAVEIMMRARQLDPASMIINRDLGCVLSWVGRIEDAQDQLEETLEMDPDFAPALAHLGRVYTAKGMFQEAFAAFDRLRALDSEYYNLDMMVGFTHAKSGNIKKGWEILDGLIAMAETQKGNAFEIAVLCAGLDDFDSAFEWFDIALENRQFPIVLLEPTIMLDDIRKDPRYASLRKRIYQP